MIVRMSYWKCKKKYWSEDKDLFEKGAVPIMENHEGFIRAMLLAEQNSVNRIAFTVWKDDSSYCAFAEHSDLKRITKMFAHMYAESGEPKPYEYVVRAHSSK